MKPGRLGGSVGRFVTLALPIVVCALGIAVVQPRIAAAIKLAKSDDVTYLPPPTQLRALALGYHAAAADMLWAKLVVEHGLRWEERRPFPEVPQYLDGILALDPEHPLVYEFVDSLLLYAREGGTEANARLARQYLEQGTRARPYDPEIWLQYGEFIAFLAPSFLGDPAESEQWRKDGAFAIARAVELGATADRTLSASSLLTRTGEKKAAIAHLQRSYALADNPETRHNIMRRLRQLEAEIAAEPAVERVETEWRSRYPFLSRSGTLLIGPHRDPAACAGPASFTDPDCPRDWPDAIQ